MWELGYLLDFPLPFPVRHRAVLYAESVRPRRRSITSPRRASRRNRKSFAKIDRLPKSPGEAGKKAQGGAARAAGTAAAIAVPPFWRKKVFRWRAPLPTPPPSRPE